LLAAFFMRFVFSTFHVVCEVMNDDSITLNTTLSLIAQQTQGINDFYYLIDKYSKLL
jgi:hypothetical protein